MTDMSSYFFLDFFFFTKRYHNIMSITDRTTITFTNACVPIFLLLFPEVTSITHLVFFFEFHFTHLSMHTQAIQGHYSWCMFLYQIIAVDRSTSSSLMFLRPIHILYVL